MKVPVVDLEVPPSARQKFERQLTFGDSLVLTPIYLLILAVDTNTKSNNSVSEASTSQDSRFRMALMIKKGNRTVLKSVNLEPTQRMHEALMEQKAIQKKQREEIKSLTLALDKRMTIQQEEEEVCCLRCCC